MDLFDGPVQHPGGSDPPMKPTLKAVLVTFSLVIALGLTLTHREPGGGVNLSVGEPLRAAKADNQKPYDLTALRVFNNTLMRINDNYVDPTRVDPKQMLLAALDQVQQRVAEVLVEPHA